MSNTDALQKWAAEILPVVQAIVDGLEVEFRLKEPTLDVDPVWLPKEEPGFSQTAEYRIKDATREVNGFTVPAPERNPPILGSDYYLPFLTKPDLVERYHWDGVDADCRLLRIGMVFKTKEAAAQNALAMLGLDPNGGDYV